MYRSGEHSTSPTVGIIKNVKDKVFENCLASKNCREYFEPRNVQRRFSTCEILVRHFTKIITSTQQMSV